MHHRLRSSRSNLLCPRVVCLDATTTAPASVAVEKELDGKLSRPWAKIANDDRVHHFFNAKLNGADDEEDTDDTSSCCSEESSVDERYLFELWRTDDDEHSSDDDECDLSTTATCSRRSSLQVSPPEQSTETKRVRFGSVKVREYGLTVGAHSAARDSCPLQLSWEHTPEQVYCAESYNSSYKESRQWQPLKRLSLSKKTKADCQSAGNHDTTGGSSRIPIDAASHSSFHSMHLSPPLK